MANISWVSDENHLLLNEKFSADEIKLWQKAFEFAVDSQKTLGSIFLLTSGTSGQQKLVCLSKKAILASSAAVNQHLEVQPQDVWLNPLPLHHIGGLSIHSRAFLTSSPVYTLSQWNAEKYLKMLTEHQVNYSSLVPTQVYDLLELKMKSPKNLKAIVVGGAHLPVSLRQKARELQFPLLPSFGASELASQITTGTATDERLKILSHMQVKQGNNQILLVKSPSLFSYYVKFINNTFVIEPPKLIDGFLETEDHVLIENGYLEPQGRGSEYVKILGEAVSLVKIERELELTSDFAFCVVAIPDERRGYNLGLACEEPNVTEATELLQKWNQKALGFERIVKIYYAKTLQRTDLGKIKKAQITQDILQNKLSSRQVSQSDA